MDMRSNPNPKTTPHAISRITIRVPNTKHTNTYEFLKKIRICTDCINTVDEKRRLTGCIGNQESAWRGQGQQEKKRNESTQSEESPPIA